MTSVRRFCLVALVAVIIGVNVWLALSTFVPALRASAVEYRFLAAPWAVLIGSIVIAFLALIALHACCARYVFPDSGPSVLPVDWRETGYLSPLTLLAFNLIALVNLFPNLGGRLQPWSYIAIDLKIWTTAAILLLFAVAIDRRSRGALHDWVWRRAIRFRPADSRHAIEIGILGFAITWACVSSPIVRFDPGLLGDEPKYLRYCGNLYQGHGFDVSRVEAIDAVPFASPAALVQNITGTLAVVPRELKHLRDDLGMLLRGGLHHRFNRAKYLGGFFIEGKDGGVYQAHGPGLSILLMPAYYIDRHVLNWRSFGKAHGADANIFPEHLVITNIAALLLYGLLGVAVFRLLMSATGRLGLSAGLAVATLATPPIGAFAFQFYPEIAAAIIVTVTARRLLYEPATTPVQAAITGLLVGYLTWLHVRFLALIAVLLVWGGLIAWRSARNRLAFIAGCAIPLGAYCLYAYHATGSLLPTAFYDARGPMLDVQSAGPGLFAFAFDAKFGLLAHAPILIIAMVGVPALFATSRRVTLFWALVVGAEFATAASKDFTGGLTSPGRFVIAVMPLVAIPLAAALARFGRSGIFQAWFALLLIVSLQSGWVYNLHHRKEFAPLVDESFSGWRFNLLFPEFHGGSWVEEGFHSLLLPLWIVTIAVTISLPYLLARRRRDEPSHDVTTSQAFAAVMMAALFATAVGVFASQKFEPSYLMPPERSAALTSAYLEQMTPSFDLSRTPAKLVAVTRQAPTGLRVDLSRKTKDFDDPLRFRFDAGETIAINITAELVEGHDPEPGVLTVAYDDGISEAPMRFRSRAILNHVYEKPGAYHLRTNVLVGKQWVSSETVVQVGAPALHGERPESLAVDAIDGFPKDVASVPPSIGVPRIAVAEGRLCFDFSPDAPAGVSRQAGQVWLAALQGETWEARMYGTLPPGERCVSIPTGTENAGSLARPRPYQTGVLVAFPQVNAGAGKATRTRLNVIWWPREEALLATPIIFYPETRSFLQEVRR